jgi:hypothetical protein
VANPWHPIATAPTDRWIWFGRAPRETPRTVDESAFKWDPDRQMWYAGLGWWHQIPQAFTHWAEITGQPPSTRPAVEGDAHATP